MHRTHLGHGWEANLLNKLDRKDGVPRARCVQPPYQERLYRLPWYRSSAPVFGRSAAPLQPSSAHPPPYRASCEKRAKRKVLWVHYKWARKPFGVSVLTIIEEGTVKETQGSLAIFTNSGPWKFYQDKTYSVRHGQVSYFGSFFFIVFGTLKFIFILLQ